MQQGSRTLGIAFSDGDRVSRLSGAVVRANGTVDGLAFGRCTVGGRDATRAVIDLFDGLEREDVRLILCAGIAPAWFNLLDLSELSRTLDRPVLSVSYESSPGLDSALRREFDGEALRERLDVYHSLPPRERVVVSSADPTASDDTNNLFVRAAGIEEGRAAAIVDSLVMEGFVRPEPVRIASLAASAHRAACCE